MLGINTKDEIHKYNRNLESFFVLCCYLYLPDRRDVSCHNPINNNRLSRFCLPINWMKLHFAIRFKRWILNLMAIQHSVDFQSISTSIYICFKLHSPEATESTKQIQLHRQNMWDLWSAKSPTKPNKHIHHPVVTLPPFMSQYMYWVGVGGASAKNVSSHVFMLQYVWRHINICICTNECSKTSCLLTQQVIKCNKHEEPYMYIFDIDFLRIF